MSKLTLRKQTSNLTKLTFEHSNLLNAKPKNSEQRKKLLMSLVGIKEKIKREKAKIEEDEKLANEILAEVKSNKIKQSIEKGKNTYYFYLGKKRKIKEKEKIWPFNINDGYLGEFATISFNPINFKYTQIYDPKNINRRLWDKATKSGKGLFITGVKSFRKGSAHASIYLLEEYAKKQNLKYILINTSVPRMKDILMTMGYKRLCKSPTDEELIKEGHEPFESYMIKFIK